MDASKRNNGGRNDQNEIPYPNGAFDQPVYSDRDCFIARRFGFGARPQGREKRIEGGTQSRKRNRESGFENSQGAKERGTRGFEGGEEGFEGGKESGTPRRKR